MQNIMWLSRQESLKYTIAVDFALAFVRVNLLKVGHRLWRGLQTLLLPTELLDTIRL